MVGEQQTCVYSAVENLHIYVIINIWLPALTDETSSQFDGLQSYTQEYYIKSALALGHTVTLSTHTFSVCVCVSVYLHMHIYIMYERIYIHLYIWLSIYLYI